MCGTRSISPRAPVTERPPARSLLIVAHGERGGAGDDRSVHDLAVRLRGRGRFRAVAAGFIRSWPSVAEARDSLPDGPLVVYPLFMSDGYYVATAIPRDLEIGPDGTDRLGRPVTVVRPPGLSPGLPPVISDLAAAKAASVAIDPRGATILLVAHGSTKDRKSRDAALAIACAIARTRRFARVRTAFLEEPPLLDDSLATAEGPVMIAGLFTGEGMHGGEDLPRAIERSGRHDLYFAGPLGRSEDFATMVCADMERHAAGMPCSLEGRLAIADSRCTAVAGG